MLRPRESRDLRLISSNVTVTPAAAVTWAHELFGNAVATATFQPMSDIEIDSVAEFQHDAVAWPVFDIAASAIYYPFRYSDDEWTDLGALTIHNILTRQGGCGIGRGPSSEQSDGHAGPAQRPERRRLWMDPLSEPGG